MKDCKCGAGWCFGVTQPAKWLLWGNIYPLPGLSLAQHTLSLMSAYMSTLCVQLWDTAASQMLLLSLWQLSKSALEMDKVLMIDICFHEILVFLYVTHPWTWCCNSPKFSSAWCMIKVSIVIVVTNVCVSFFSPSSIRVCDWGIFNFWWQRFWFVVKLAITGLGCQQCWWEPF